MYLWSHAEKEKPQSLSQTAKLPERDRMYRPRAKKQRLNKPDESAVMNEGEPTLASPPRFNVLTPGGSFAHVIRLLNYLFVNLVSLQISPGDRITLSTGAGWVFKPPPIAGSAFISNCAESN